MRIVSLLPVLVITTFTSLWSASAMTVITTTTTTTATATATDFGLLQQLRGGGGGWFGLFGSRAEDRYRQSLEEQILILERQTRAARDESMQLRKLAKLTGRGKQPGDATIVASLKEEIAVLEKQIVKLEKFTQELQVLLKEEKERSAELEEKLIAAGADALDLRNQHLLAMEELEKSMLIKANKQIEELNALMDARVKEAAVRARKEALLFMDEKINEAVSKVETKARADLEEERQKAADAVEKERAKMRKLVKVLAEREKKASTPATASGKASSNTVAAGSSSRKQQSVTPTSVRSPIKNT